MDIIISNKKIPELNIGEWIYIHNFGANTSSISTEYNGFTKPKTIYIWKDCDESFIQNN
jgi:diaminopimelate decarboxylase